MQNPFIVRVAAWPPRLAILRTVAAPRVLLVPLVLAVLSYLTPSPAPAQQFVTDDAAIAEHRACQLEGWHGESASWLLPACQPIRNLEFSAGIGLVVENGARSTEWVIQGKYLLRELARGAPALGLVAGVGFGPLSQVVGDGVAGAFAYVPVSVPLAGERVVLHGNLGWYFERDEHEHDGVPHGESHHALTWALRGDLAVSRRFTLIGEFFGENRLRPEFQVGVRSSLIPDRLLLDVSWGGHTAPAVQGPGWAAGLAWTPPPFF